MNEHRFAGDRFATMKECAIGRGVWNAECSALSETDLFRQLVDIEGITQSQFGVGSSGTAAGVNAIARLKLLYAFALGFDDSGRVFAGCVGQREIAVGTG